MSGCPFCDIVAGRAPADVVAEDRFCLAFRPLNPHTRGHVLFIPKWHVVSAVAAPMAAGIVLWRAARYLRAQGPQGNLLTSSGRLATQTVDHLHIHVIPRGPSHDLAADWPWMRDGH